MWHWFCEETTEDSARYARRQWQVTARVKIVAVGAQREDGWLQFVPRERRGEMWLRHQSRTTEEKTRAPHDTFQGHLQMVKT